jgi:hypothetical protein
MKKFFATPAEVLANPFIIVIVSAFDVAAVIVAMTWLLLSSGLFLLVPLLSLASFTVAAQGLACVLLLVSLHLKMLLPSLLTFLLLLTSLLSGFPTLAGVPTAPGVPAITGAPASADVPSSYLTTGIPALLQPCCCW